MLIPGSSHTSDSPGPQQWIKCVGFLSQKFKILTKYQILANAFVKCVILLMRVGILHVNIKLSSLSGILVI